MRSGWAGGLDLRAIAETTRRDGLAVGLTAAFDRREPLPCSPAGRTLLPRTLLPVVADWAVGGVVVRAAACRVELRSHPVAESEHLALVEVTPRDRSPESAPGRSAWPARLLAVRVGLGRRLLAHAIDHLSGRTFDGAPMTERQLVRAEIAEIAVALETVETFLDILPAGAETALWHSDLDQAERALTRLFGAAGFLDDHPARVLRLVALIRDVYAPDESMTSAA